MAYTLFGQSPGGVSLEGIRVPVPYRLARLNRHELRLAFFMTAAEAAREHAGGDVIFPVTPIAECDA